MFLRKIMIAIAALASLTASAHEFRCGDENRLERILAELRSSCGTTPIEICTSRGFKGGSAEGAIAACEKAFPGNRAYCAQDVTCPTSPLCTARGFKNATVDGAIQECVRAFPGNRAYCAQDVTCARLSVCSSRNLRGGSVDAAIDECERAFPGNRAYCAQDVTCTTPSR